MPKAIVEIPFNELDNLREKIRDDVTITDISVRIVVEHPHAPLTPQGAKLPYISFNDVVKLPYHKSVWRPISTFP